MIGQLRELRAIGAHSEYIGVETLGFLCLSGTCHQEPLAVGRQLWCGETAARQTENQLLNAGVEVESPDFTLFLVGETGALNHIFVTRVKHRRHSARIV